MKKLLFVLCIGMALVGCKKKGCTDPNSSNYDPDAEKDDGSCIPKSATSGYWMFDLTVNGVNHKAEGYQSDNPYYYGPSGNGSYNHCISLNSTGGNTLHMGIADQSASSYINGDNGALNLTIQNPSVGVCYANLTNYANTYLPSNGFYLCNSNFGYTLSPTDTNTQISPFQTIIPINITDLGTATSGMAGNVSNYGNPFMGDYSGTIYLCSGTTTNPTLIYHYDYPVNIDLEFVAQRYPQ